MRKLIGILILLLLASFFFSLYYFCDEKIAQHGYLLCFILGIFTSVAIVVLVGLVYFALELIFEK